MELRGVELRGVELRGFWCGTEGVELRSFECGTEGGGTSGLVPGGTEGVSVLN